MRLPAVPPVRHHGRSARVRRSVAAVSLAAALSLTAPGTTRAEDDPPAPAPAATAVNGYVDNPFIPTEANLGDCVSALPRPDCGSAARGGPAQWMTFAAMTSALAFIAWRVVRSVRRRDRALAVRPEA